MPNVIDRIAELVGRRRETAVGGYRQLVEDVADDRDRDPEEAEAILADAGKTVADLAADAELLRNRRAWRAVVDREPELRADVARIDADLAKAREKFDAAKRKFTETSTALNDEREAAHRGLREVDVARRHLMNSSPATREQARAMQAVRPDVEAVRALERELRAAEAGLLALKRRHAAHDPEPSPADKLTGRRTVPNPVPESELAAAQADVDNVRAKIAEHQARIDEARAHSDELRELVYTP